MTVSADMFEEAPEGPGLLSKTIPAWHLIGSVAPTSSQTATGLVAALPRTETVTTTPKAPAPFTPVAPVPPAPPAPPSRVETPPPTTTPPAAPPAAAETPPGRSVGHNRGHHYGWGGHPLK